MKVAFVVPPLVGHVNPTVSIAASLLARGHQVSWIGHPSAIAPLLPRGADVWSLGDLPPEVAAAVAERSRRLRGLESVQFLWQDFLVPLARATRPLLERLLGERSPDVLVVDQQALAGALAARRLGLRWLTLCTTSAGVTAPLAAFPKVAAWIEAQLATLQEEAGLPVLPAADLSPSLVIVLSTRALIGARPLPPQACLVGPAITGRTDETPFPWDRLLPGRRVLVSLGTVSADRGEAFYGAVFDAFAGTDLQAIVVAPSREGAPDNVLVRERIPQLAVLPHVHAVVTHAGHNTVCEALSHGLPLVVAPIRDDQPIVAQQVVEAGAGVRVRFGNLSASTLRSAVLRVLDDPSFAAAADRIRQSFAEAGGAEAAAEIIESQVA